jgi:hypothetical protein
MQVIPTWFLSGNINPVPTPTPIPPTDTVPAPTPDPTPTPAPIAGPIQNFTLVNAENEKDVKIISNQENDKFECSRSSEIEYQGKHVRNFL